MGTDYLRPKFVNYLMVQIEPGICPPNEVKLTIPSSTWFCGLSILSNNQQSHVRDDIEDQEDDFEQSEERVNDHVEGFSGNGKQYALCAIH